LLRERFKAKGGKPFPHCAKRRQAEPDRTTVKPAFVEWLDSEPNTNRAPRWLKEVNPSAAWVPRWKRANVPNPLLKIPAHYPKRLPRRA